MLIDARNLRPARLTAPPSKSDALRVLALAWMVDRPGWLDALGPRPWATDAEILAAGLELLGPPTGEIGHSADGSVSATVGRIACGDGGAPFRFLLALAAVEPGRYSFTGSPRLGERPHLPLIAALLGTLGPSGLIVRRGNPWPMEVESTGETGEPTFRVTAAQSSQYASALAFAAARLALREHRSWTVEIEGPVTSPGYLDLTLAGIDRAGFRVQRGPEGRISRRQPERMQTPSVPGDWSAAGFLLPIAWRVGGSVAGLDLEARHPDRAMLELLEAIGLRIKPTPKGLVVGGDATGGLRASGAECPDLVPALAALACVLPGESTFTDLASLRGKETDRLEAVQELLTAAGAVAGLEGDTLRITAPVEKVTEVRFDARGDHRMIMTAATLAVLLGCRLSIQHPEGVEKSFPGFFGQLALAGVEVC